MGAPTTTEALALLEMASRRDMELADAFRTALESCLPYAERAMNNAREIDKFQKARSAYRLGAAALGIEHE